MSLLGDVLEQPPTIGIYARAYPLARLINVRLSPVVKRNTVSWC